ncbi:MAG TPA: PQQ-binding-like beta-propeller repeat protein [Pyrinomonadaceae bacterium]|jgi:outer membrane protein assembly factor BamB|nr:PQQ-binding-like beta-propeller repeat protein [Pyrinomonadaceae bacterium]
MFESQDTTPWYRSRSTLIGASVCFAMLALALFYQFYGYRYFSDRDAHYSELERHRAAQAALAANQPPPAAADEQVAAPNQNTPAAAADANGQQQQQPATATSTTGGNATTANGQDANHTAAPPASSAGRNYWTNFRGPNRDGRYEERAVRVNWPAGGLKPMWKQPVGGGFSSFVVADGTAYTIEQRRAQEVVAAYNVETGRELWTHGWNAEFSPDSTGDGPRSTPTWDAGRLYALGAEGELRCLDAKTGKLYWQKNILSDNNASNIQWGMSASPLVVDDKVVVLAGGTSGKGVVAYNKMTGARVWSALNDRASYTSPMLVTLSGKRQVLVVTASRIAGLDPADGGVLWSHPWDVSMGINVSQPLVVGANRFFISAGYGKGAALVELQGSGRSFTTKAVWENINLKTKFNSPVVHNGYAYGLDEGILTCVDLATGERKWKGGRYGYGQVLLASNHLIVTTDTGEIVLVKADPTGYAEVTKFSALTGKTWNVPALANGRLLVRNGNEMAAYNLAE